VYVRDACGSAQEARREHQKPRAGEMALGLGVGRRFPRNLKVGVAGVVKGEEDEVRKEVKAAEEAICLTLRRSLDFCDFGCGYENIIPGRETNKCENTAGKEEKPIIQGIEEVWGLEEGMKQIGISDEEQQRVHDHDRAAIDTKDVGMPYPRPRPYILLFRVQV